MAERLCKDCAAEGVTSQRPTPHPGPRCVTHHRAAKKQRSHRAHELRVEKNFGITGEEYWTLYRSQDGLCFICRRSTGARKRLAVDHDHHLEGCRHEPEVGCRHCVRALVCGPCNELLGRYGIYALCRAVEVLANPPARRVLHQVAEMTEITEITTGEEML